jgi:cell division protein ZapA (FtsZ GTPase activity inhibitor)
VNDSLKKMNGGKESQFDVLGCQIKFRAEASSGQGHQFAPAEIVEYVLNEAAALRSKNTSLDDKQIATLLALQFAREKLVLEKELQDGLSSLHKSASHALQLVEEVCPSTTN